MYQLQKMKMQIMRYLLFPIECDLNMSKKIDNRYLLSRSDWCYVYTAILSLWCLLISSKIDNRHLLSRRNRYYRGLDQSPWIDSLVIHVVSCRRTERRRGRKGDHFGRSRSRHLWKTQAIIQQRKAKAIVRRKGAKVETWELRTAWIPDWSIGRETRVEHVVVVDLVVVGDMVSNPLG